MGEEGYGVGSESAVWGWIIAWVVGLWAGVVGIERIKGAFEKFESGADR